MKTKYKFTFLVLFLFTSCEDYLNKSPLDKPSDATFYSNQQELLMAVNGCYNYITSRIEWNIPTQFTNEAVTDIFGTRSSGSYFNVIKTGALSSSDALPSLIWSYSYTGINRTNALLDNMNKAEAITDPVLFKRIKSEARVIRAICYIELIQKFGDVPLIEKLIDIIEASKITRTNKSDVLQFIYKELDEAAVDLPLKYDNNTDKGRITKGVAFAMKARVALYNKDWLTAKNAAKACMDLNNYKLYPSYRDLFKYKGEYNSEIILDCQYMQKEREYALQQSVGTRNSKGTIQQFPTEDMIASFECTDGKPIDESQLYDPTNPFANRDPRLFGAVIIPRVWDGNTVKTNGTVFYGFEFMSSKESLYGADGKTILPTCLYQKERTVLDQKSGKIVENQDVTNPYASRTGYVSYKYMDEANVATPNNNYLNFILCRYAEVLLIYAEASIEIGQIDQSVLDAVNMVRARAYGNTTSTSTDISATNYPKIMTTDQAELRKIVRRERKVELCFEGFRYEDLKRWGILVKALNKRKTYGRPENYSMLSLTNIPVIDEDGLVTFSYAEDRYGLTNEVRKLRFYEEFGIITEKFNLYPIPIGEIQLNSNLTQNTGY
jgi:hypothetical protein